MQPQSIDENELDNDYDSWSAQELEEELSTLHYSQENSIIFQKLKVALARKKELKHLENIEKDVNIEKMLKNSNIKKLADEDPHMWDTYRIAAARQKLRQKNK